MKKKKALKRLEAAILEVDRQSEHNTELRRTQIQLTRRLEDGQAWANAATSRLRQAEETERANREEIEALRLHGEELANRITTLQSMNDEAGRVIREKSLAISRANEMIRRREQVISLYAEKFGGGPDSIPVDGAPMADDDDDDEPKITISFKLMGVKDDGGEVELQSFQKTFGIDDGGMMQTFSDDNDDRTDDDDDKPDWQHCGDPDCVICNAAEEMFRDRKDPQTRVTAMMNDARQEQRKKVFAELGEVLDAAARILSRPFTNGKGVQSWELRGRLANLQIEFAELNANDRGMEEDPPAYRELRSKIIDFARGVRELTGEGFGDALTPQRALADGADPAEVPAPWGTKRLDGLLWKRLEEAFRDGDAPAPSKLREMTEMAAQTSTIAPEDAEMAAAEWWKGNGGGIEGLRGRVSAFRAALDAEKARTLEELTERAEKGGLSGSLMSEVIGGAIARAAKAARQADTQKPAFDRVQRQIFEQIRELDRQEEAPSAKVLRPAGALAVHVHETVDAAGGRILEVENVRTGAAQRFYIMMDAAGVPELVPVVGVLD